MKNLIIHPKDHTTRFLSQIYAPLKNKTVTEGGVTKSELRELIETHVVDFLLFFLKFSPNLLQEFLANHLGG